MTIEVYRGGNAAPFWNDVKIGTASIRVEYSKLEVRLSEPKGYGHRVFRLHFKSDSFVDLARAMLQADAKEAIKAFGIALADPEHWYPVIPEAAEVPVARMERSEIRG